MSATFPLAKMAYGGDYNPEQWPEEVWQEDVRLMKEAGVTLVSLGIFSWAKLEPQPGQYDFAWFDRIIDLLHANGIQVDLATATASPPPWLAKNFPDSLPVTRDGTKLWHGSRQHYCPSSSAYRQAAKNIVSKIVERYSKHPAVVMWHINNEYACHVSECFCEESVAAFRAWLQNRYGTLEALNAAWGTAFWSQQYGAWDEIQAPHTTPTFINPTQQLDWRRFSSDTILECHDMECEIIRASGAQQPITTNFMCGFKPLDYWKWAEHEDLVSLDCYPDLTDDRSLVQAAFDYDLHRSLGKGKPWLLMEQATSQVNWRPQNPVKGPGFMRLGSHQAIARGSDGVMFFQWRAAKAGAEKFHSGLVPHSGTNTRTWREVVQLGNELPKLDPVRDARIQADVAIVYDWDSWWAMEGEGRVSEDVRYAERIRYFYDKFYDLNITTDFVAPTADLSAYKLVVIPALHVTTAEAAANIENYVSNGGNVLISFISGIVNENDHIWLGGYPAPFRKLLGLRVEEFSPMAPHWSNQVRTEAGNFANDLWFDIIDLEGASALANFENDFYAGLPAVTKNQFGQGQAFYVGTRLDQDGLAWLLKEVTQAAGVAPVLDVPQGIEAVRRSNGANEFLYLLNHNLQATTVAFGGQATELLSGSELDSSITLDARGVAILQLR